MAQYDAMAELQDQLSRLNWFLMQEAMSRKSHERSLDYLTKQGEMWRERELEGARLGKEHLDYQNKLSLEKAFKELSLKLANDTEYNRLLGQAQLAEVQGNNDLASQLRLQAADKARPIVKGAMSLFDDKPLDQKTLQSILDVGGTTLFGRAIGEKGRAIRQEKELPLKEKQLGIRQMQAETSRMRAGGKTAEGGVGIDEKGILKRIQDTIKYYRSLKPEETQILDEMGRAKLDAQGTPIRQKNYGGMSFAEKESVVAKLGKLVGQIQKRGVESLTPIQEGFIDRVESLVGGKQAAVEGENQVRILADMIKKMLKQQKNYDISDEEAMELARRKLAERF